MEIQLRNHLRNYPPLNEHIPSTKIHGGVSPQGTETPYIVIKLISNPRGQMGTRWARIQVSVYDNSYGRAKHISKIVEQAIREFEGGFATFNENVIDLYDSDTRLHHIPVDSVFYFQTKEVFNE